MLLRDVIQLPEDPLAKRLQRAIAVIDSIHTVPPLPPFPLVVTSRRNENGAYLARERPRRPGQIAVSRRGTHPELTLAHEVAHLLDHMCLNPIGAGFGSDNHEPLFDPLFAVLSRDPLLQGLHVLLQRSARYATPSARRYMTDMLTPHEIWARCYTQWITTCSDDPVFTAQLHRIREQCDHFAGQTCTFHWEAEPFKPIMNAVDNLMKAFGFL